MTHVICIVGLCGVGKSKVTELFNTPDPYHTVYFGQVVIDALEEAGLEKTPDNERQVRNQLRAEHGMDVMAQKSIGRIQAHMDKGESVLIDGLYSFSEYVLMKSKFGKSMIVVAVHAERAARIARLSIRPVRPMSEAQMDKRDWSEITELEKGQPIALADFHMLNNGTIDALELSVKDIQDKLARL